MCIASATSDKHLIDLEPGIVVDPHRTLRCNRMNDSPRTNEDMSQVDIRHHGYYYAGVLRAMLIDCLNDPTSPGASLSNSSNE